MDDRSHSLDEGSLCMHVGFKDKTMLSSRLACDMFIVGADPGVWKTENDEIIREYMTTIPR